MECQDGCHRAHLVVLFVEREATQLLESCLYVLNWVVCFWRLFGFFLFVVLLGLLLYCLFFRWEEDTGTLTKEEECRVTTLDFSHGEDSHQKDYGVNRNELHINYMEFIPRLDRLPFSRWHLALVVVLGVSWIFDGFEVSSLSLCSSSIKTSLSVENSSFYLISTFYMAGCAIGGLIFGFLSYFIGRKQIFIVRST